MSPFPIHFPNTLDPCPGHLAHSQACGMVPQMSYHFDQGIPSCTPSHLGLSSNHPMQTGCFGPCSIDSGMDLRCMQRSILSKLDNVERSVSATEGIHTRITQMGREIEELNEQLKRVGAALSQLQHTMGECKEKISDSAAKLEMVRVGLNEFATDMNSLIDTVDSGPSTQGSQDSQGSQQFGASPPGLDGDKVDMPHYFDDKGLGLVFE
ncbi:hypothetical protein F5X97DRAFT_329694 [Nemania serpens]|nr:hypothetical protein F5X97DRAFT_329694 [Nemania serpens]